MKKRKKSKDRKPSYPKTSSAVLLQAHQQTGAGFHGKNRKAQRRQEKVNLQKEQ